jgi:hypothetical protein
MGGTARPAVAGAGERSAAPRRAVYQDKDVLIDNAVTRYGQLLGDAVRDRALLDWLVAHYRSLPPEAMAALAAALPGTRITPP